MNSTIKHFKIANKVLLEFIKLRKFKELQELDRSFVQPVKSRTSDENEIIDKESDFQKYLKNMQFLTEKHYQRL